MSDSELGENEIIDLPRVFAITRPIRDRLGKREYIPGFLAQELSAVFDGLGNDETPVARANQTWTRITDRRVSNDEINFEQMKQDIDTMISCLEKYRDEIKEASENADEDYTLYDVIYEEAPTDRVYKAIQRFESENNVFSALKLYREQLDRYTDILDRKDW